MPNCEKLPVLIIVTHGCLFRCRSCCYEACPEDIDKHIDLESMKTVIDDMVAIGSHEMNFSGGEPTIYWQDTLSAIEYAKQKGICCHLSTNLWWGSEPKDIVRQRVSQLHATGLDRLLLSYDEYHAEFLSFDDFSRAVDEILKFNDWCVKIRQVDGLDDSKIDKQLSVYQGIVKKHRLRIMGRAKSIDFDVTPIPISTLTSQENCKLQLLEILPGAEISANFCRLYRHKEACFSPGILGRAIKEFETSLKCSQGLRAFLNEAAKWGVKPSSRGYYSCFEMVGEILGKMEVKNGRRNRATVRS